MVERQLERSESLMMVGVNWVNFDITDINGYPNNQDSGNPEITTIDISQIADFSDSLLIQFYYYDNDYWAWYWAVDDKAVRIATIFQEDFSNGIPSDWQDHYFTSGGNIILWEYRGLNTSPDSILGQEVHTVIVFKRLFNHQPTVMALSFLILIIMIIMG